MIEFGGERNESSLLIISKEDLIRDLGRIKTLVSECVFLVFEGCGDLHVSLSDSDKQRTSVRGKFLLALKIKRVEGEGGGNNETSHSSPSIMTGDLDSVHVDLLNAIDGGDGLFDLACGNVFALPTKGISNAIDKEHEPFSIRDEKISGSKESIAFLEDVSDDLLFCGLFIGVSIEFACGIAVIDEADKFSDFPGFAGDTKTGRVAERRLGIGVETDEFDRVKSGDKRGDEANCPKLVSVVEKCCVSLCGCVKLSDLRNVESCLELSPHVLSHSVSDRDSHLVGCVERRRRMKDEIATKFANVLDDGTVVGRGVLPKARSRELATKDKTTSGIPRSPDADHSTGRVIERKSAIDAIGRSDVEGNRESKTRGVETKMVDDRSLWKSRCSTGVDVKENIRCL